MIEQIPYFQLKFKVLHGYCQGQIEFFDCIFPFVLIYALSLRIVNNAIFYSKL